MGTCYFVIFKTGEPRRQFLKHVQSCDHFGKTMACRVCVCVLAGYWRKTTSDSALFQCFINFGNISTKAFSSDMSVLLPCCPNRPISNEKVQITYTKQLKKIAELYFKGTILFEPKKTAEKQTYPQIFLGYSHVASLILWCLLRDCMSHKVRELAPNDLLLSRFKLTLNMSHRVL